MPQSYQTRYEPVSCKELVILAVAFLSSEEARLSRFLSLTGLDPSDIPQLLGQKDFQLAILDGVVAALPDGIEMCQVCEC